MVLIVGYNVIMKQVKIESADICKGMINMQAQAYEGYFENGFFYSSGQTIKLPERRRVYITVLDEPADICNTESTQKRRRSAQLSEIKKMISLSMDEELPFSNRSTDVREPINLSD